MENRDDGLVIQALQTSELYQGPIPHPDILKKFGSVDPSYPERIMKMTEDNNRSEIRIRERDSMLGLFGQVFSFVLGLTGFGISALFALKGLEAGAIAAAIGGVAPIIIAAIGNLRK
jgi:uncharacterized membrane protein